MRKCVSIIVPVYNSEKYLANCIESVLNQTYGFFELLLIDDGSTDRSGQICDEYRTKDSRIRVFHKENGGVSSARNVGLEIALGDYLTFLDSDDGLDLDTLESLVHLMQLNPSVDLIDFPICHFGPAGGRGRLVTVNEERIIRGELEKTKYWFYYPRFESCGRLFKKSKIGNLRFNTDLKVGEDTVFFMNYYLYCDECIATPNGGYNYYYREGSAMNQLNDGTRVNNDLIMLRELEGSQVERHPIYGALIYRVIIPKLRDGSLTIGQVSKYKRYIIKTELVPVIKNKLPLKVFFSLALLKGLVLLNRR